MHNINYVAFAAVIISSIMGIEYNFRIIRKLYIGPKELSIRIHLENNKIGLLIVTILSLGLIFIS